MIKLGNVLKASLRGPMPDFAGRLAFYWDPIMEMLEELDVDSFMGKLFYVWNNVNSMEGYYKVIGGFMQEVVKGTFKALSKMGIREIPGLSATQLNLDIEMALQGSLEMSEWIESNPDEGEIAMAIINEILNQVITQAKAMGFDIYAELAKLIPQGRVMVNQLFNGMLLPMMPDSLSTPLSELMGDDVFQG